MSIPDSSSFGSKVLQDAVSMTLMAVSGLLSELSDSSVL